MLREPAREQTAVPGADTLTVSVAESCTGGLLAARIVDTPGSGEWFLGGLVAYDEDTKFRLLGVAPGRVITRRAAAQMAAGVRSLIGADLGVSITGVAGPDTEEGQPVGTVYVGVSGPGSDYTMRLALPGEPEDIRAGAARHGYEQVAWARREPGNGRREDRPYRVFVPEGGLVMESGMPFQEVTVDGDRVRFALMGEQSAQERLRIATVGRDLVEILVSADPAEPGMAVRLGAGEDVSLQASTGAPLHVGWRPRA